MTGELKAYVGTLARDKLRELPKLRSNGGYLYDLHGIKIYVSESLPRTRVMFVQDGNVVDTFDIPEDAS